MMNINLPNLNANENETSYYVDKTWVQCESPSCLKWRLVSKVTNEGAELDLDRPWHCHMNPDPLFSHCSVPQGPFPDNSLFKKLGVKVVYSSMPVGSLVLVKASKWPWWPAILSADPDMREYMMQDSDGNVEKYHVEFLGKPHTRFWATVNNIELYRTSSTKPKSLRGALRKSYEVAIEEAAKISDMECEDRLQICHFKPAECEPGSIEEIGDTLIIEGFRFESATCKEDLRLFSNFTAL